MATVRIAGKDEKTTLDGTEEFISGIAAGDRNITTKTMLSDRLLSKSVAGGTDVALTLTEALYGQMVFTGVLTGNISVTVPDSMPKRWAVYNNTTGSYTLTFKPVSGTGVVLTQGIRDNVVSDGTNAVFDGISQSANKMVGIQKWAKGADIASATALTVGADGNYFDITGTTTITSITTVSVGAVIKLHFDGVLTITHHSTDLVLPGGASKTTTANDEAEFVEYDTGKWRCTNYSSASGDATLGSNTFAGGQNFARATVASHATTADIWGAAGNQIDWTGTATTTAFPNAPQAGVERVLICAGASSFTAGANMLIDGVVSGNTVTCAANDQVVVRAVSATQFKLSRIKYDGTPQAGIKTYLSARTSNTILGVTDSGKLIDITSGTFTQTFDPCATLTNGWSVRYRNSGTGAVTLDPSGAELIDGLASFIMYPGETRDIQCDGSALTSVVVSSFYLVVTTTGTFQPPPGYSAFGALVWSAGASGQRTNSISTISAGGGGGGCCSFNLLASTFGATETITIGAGGAAVTTVAAGNLGGNTSIGSLAVVYAGTVSHYRGGSVVSGLASSTQAVGYEANTGAGASTLALSTIWGGAGASNSAAVDSGNSVFGGAAGGGLDASAVVRAPGTSMRGGSGGAALSAGNGTAGTVPGGGGGATQTGTSSGAGARGEVRIWGLV